MKWDVLAITDEIYEHIIYDGARTSPRSPWTECESARSSSTACRRPTVLPAGGWATSSRPTSITGAIRKMHDFMTVGAPAPLQEAGAVALRLPDSYYVELAAHYKTRRDRLLGVLERGGPGALCPRRARTTSCAISSPLRERHGLPNDVEFGRFLVKDIGVAAVPASSFFRDPAAGKDLIRFTFCKKEKLWQRRPSAWRS